MSTTDPSAATGMIPYLPSRCECGELATLHAINGKGQRAACSSSLCDCRRFVKAGDDR